MIRFTLISLLVAIPCACSGGGSAPALQPPTGDVSGTWLIQEEILTASGVCAGEIGRRESYSLSVSQNGNGITVVSPAGTFNGSLNGNRIEWRGSYPEDGGTTTITGMNVTYTSTQLSGTTSWTWSDGSTTCVGTTRVVGAKSSPARMNGMVTIIFADEVEVANGIVVVARESGTQQEPEVIEPIGEGLFVLPAGLWDIGLTMDPEVESEADIAWQFDQQVIGGQNLFLLFD